MHTWTLTLRNNKTGKSFIWNSDSVLRAIREAYYYWRSIRCAIWTREADSFLLKEYHRLRKQEIAVECSRLLCHKVTPNAVIGRYNRISNVQPDEIVYFSPLMAEKPSWRAPEVQDA